MDMSNIRVQTFQIENKSIGAMFIRVKTGEIHKHLSRVEGIITLLDSREAISEVILSFWMVERCDWYTTVFGGNVRKSNSTLSESRERMNGSCVISAHMRLKVTTVPGLKRSCKELYIPYSDTWEGVWSRL